jgi:repressor LexA
VLAVEDMDRIDFAPLFKDEDHFCLKVKGDSMIDDQIADGDYAVIRRQRTARDGDIVAALVEGTDATLKRFFKEKSRFRLQPANSRMKPIYSDDVEVLGVLGGEPVLVRDGRFLLASFHPELTDDPRVHERFLAMIEEGAHVRA